MNQEPQKHSVPDALLRPAATLLSGSGLAFLIGYAAKPVILRLFPVAAFGVYESVIALVAVALPVASLRYEDALLIPDSDEEARDVLGAATLLTLASVGLATLGVLLLGHLAPLEMQPWLWTAPILLLVLRVSKLGEIWLTRQKRFGQIATSGLAQSAVGTTARILAGLKGLGAGGLLLGFGLGHLVAATVNTVAAWPSIPRRSGTKLRTTLARFRRFPAYSAPAALVSALATRLPFLVLLWVFGAEVLGWFGQAFNVLFVPLTLVGTAVGQVFFVRAAEAHRAGELADEADHTHRLLVTLSIVPLAGACAAAPEVFGFLFGPDWRTAGDFARRIAPWIALAAIGSPLTRIFDVAEEQRRDLLMNGIAFLFVGAALVAGVILDDAVAAITWLGVAGALSRAILIRVTLATAGLSQGRIFKPYLRSLGEGLVVFGLVLGAGALLSPALTTLSLAVILALWSLATLGRLRAGRL